MGTHQHKKDAPPKANIAVLSVSSTRSLDTDESGHWIKNASVNAGHDVVLHRVIDDDQSKITELVIQCIKDTKIEAIIITGGTGIALKDVSIEAVRSLFQKELSAFSVLFAQLSYQQIGAAAMLSRATAGVSNTTLIFCIPGSLNACKLACTQLILPELSHLIKHAKE